LAFPVKPNQSFVDVFMKKRNYRIHPRFYAPGLTFLVVQRNTTREKQKAKIVVDAVREHG
jgi:hypothetical protein